MDMMPALKGGTDNGAGAGEMSAAKELVEDMVVRKQEGLPAA
jgi:hypothetical protein